MKSVMSGVTAIANAVVMDQEHAKPPQKPERTRHRNKVTPSAEEIKLIEAARTCPDLIAELQESIRKRHRGKTATFRAPDSPSSRNSLALKL